MTIPIINHTLICSYLRITCTPIVCILCCDVRISASPIRSIRPHHDDLCILTLYSLFSSILRSLSRYYHPSISSIETIILRHNSRDYHPSIRSIRPHHLHLCILTLSSLFSSILRTLLDRYLLNSSSHPNISSLTHESAVLKESYICFTVDILGLQALKTIIHQFIQIPPKVMYSSLQLSNFHIRVPTKTL